VPRKRHDAAAGFEDEKCLVARIDRPTARNGLLRCNKNAGGVVAAHGRAIADNPAFLLGTTPGRSDS
jgi:hypothetical protein